MSKAYTKVGDKVYQPTDWIHYFYLRIKWNGDTNLRKLPGLYWEEIR